MTNVILATITGFCSCAVCCGPHAAGLTASGKKPTPQHTVAGPRSLPFGTVVIANNRTYRVEDRTSRRFDGRFDIYFSSHSAAKQFGIKTNLVTIITLPH